MRCNCAVPRAGAAPPLASRPSHCPAMVSYPGRNETKTDPDAGKPKAIAQSIHLAAPDRTRSDAPPRAIKAERPMEQAQGGKGDATDRE